MPYEKQVVFRAGTIPYIIEDDQLFMMFMKPSNAEFGGDEYQIAKGRVEDGEDAETAALREAREELGLFMSNVVSSERLGVFMGRTTVYIAKVRNRTMFGTPSFETEDTVWMTEQEFANAGRQLHLHVVQAAAARINQIESM